MNQYKVYAALAATIGLLLVGPITANATECPTGQTAIESVCVTIEATAPLSTPIVTDEAPPEPVIPVCGPGEEAQPAGYEYMCGPADLADPSLSSYSDPVDYPGQGFAYDCDTETLISAGWEYPMLDYEVENLCGHLPTIIWPPEVTGTAWPYVPRTTAPVTTEPTPVPAPVIEEPAPVQEPLPAVAAQPAPQVKPAPVGLTHPTKAYGRP